MADHIPPQTTRLKWCSVCGRNDRFAPFTGRSHFSKGDRCAGQPETVTYYLAKSAKEAAEESS